MPGSESSQIPARHVLLYDGVCGFCQRTVRWMLQHDPDGRLLFAPQQLPLAAEVFARHGLDLQQVNSAVLVTNFGRPSERLAIRSNAILGCLTLLGGRWALLASLVRLVPRPLRDAVYRWLARNRLRLFRTVELCACPHPPSAPAFSASDRECIFARATHSQESSSIAGRLNTSPLHSTDLVARILNCPRDPSA